MAAGTIGTGIADYSYDFHYRSIEQLAVELDLRDATTPPPQFRKAAHRISLILATEALKDIPTKSASVATPLAEAPGRRVAGDVLVVPILRAGMGMLDAVLELVPGEALRKVVEDVYATPPDVIAIVKKSME